MPTGTVMPSPWFYFTTAAGAPAAGYLLFTYASGTTTKQNTYTDSTLGVANANPLTLDSAGRAVVFLDPHLVYKFVVALPTDTDPPASPVKTIDVVQAIPAQPTRLYTDTSQRVNVGVAETPLGNYNLPAGTLFSNGQAIRVTWAGYFAANGNTKTLKGYFSGNSITTLVSGAYNNVFWRVSLELIRLTATTQDGIWTTLVGGGVDPALAHIAPAETLANVVTIQLTGTSNTAGSDVAQTIMLVEFLP